MTYFWVGIAGTLGAILRYIIGVSLFTNSTFPFATLIVNLTGSFLLAWLTTNLFKRVSINPVVATAISTGFVGSFTTFSTLSVETVNLFRTGEILLGFIYLSISIIGGLAMSRLGFSASQEVRKP